MGSSDHQMPSSPGVPPSTRQLHLSAFRVCTAPVNILNVAIIFLTTLSVPCLLCCLCQLYQFLVLFLLLLLLLFMYVLMEGFNHYYFLYDPQYSSRKPLSWAMPLTPCNTENDFQDKVHGYTYNTSELSTLQMHLYCELRPTMLLVCIICVHVCIVFMHLRKLLSSSPCLPSSSYLPPKARRNGPFFASLD